MADHEVIAKIAQGIYAIAQERNTAAVYREDLKFFDWILRHNKELMDFLDNPMVAYANKCKALDNLFKDLIIPDVLLVIKLIVKDNAISSFSDIRAEFNKLSDEKTNIAEGIVYTPYKLDGNTMLRLERALRNKIGKTVILKQIEDKDMIAGVKIVLDGTSYELSIASKLDSIKDELATKKA